MASDNLSFNFLSDFVVRNFGKFDFDATMRKFSTRLSEFEAMVEKEDAAIADAVNGVFDTRVSKGGSINMDGIVTFAIPALNPNAENFVILKDRIKNWVRANSAPIEKKSDNGASTANDEASERTYLFSVSKGKGGGRRRLADVVKKPVSD